jgi:hypothetical protein
MIDLVQNIKPISYVKSHTTEVVKNVIGNQISNNNYPKWRSKGSNY